MHIANGVNMHHERDKGHHAHHHGGQAVDQEADFHFEVAHHHPGVKGFVQARAALHYRHECHHGNHKGQQHASNGQAVR